MMGLATAVSLAVTMVPASAQVAYTNSVLNGCYAHLSSSVDDGTNIGRDVVGTFCFDGNGNIVGTSGTPALSGSMGNTNGVAKTTSDQTGTYSVTNTPGDGMGTFTIGCGTHAFVIANVDPSTGIAKGLRYILIKKKKDCTNGPNVIGGAAEYQGPISGGK